MSALNFKIEDRGGTMKVVWSNGSTQDATPVEVELWKRNRELEKAGAELGKYLAPKVLEDAAICLKKLADLKPDKSAIVLPTDKSKSVATGSSASSLSSTNPDLRKRLEEKKRERERLSATAAANADSAPAFGKRPALAGPKGGLPG